MTRTPTPAVTTLDGIGIQPLLPGDAAVVAQLLKLRGNQFVVGLPPDEAAIATLLDAASGQPWTLPLAAARDSECLGVAATALPDLKSLTASFLTVVVDPNEATLPLAMCIRHLFWQFPLRRLYSHVPLTDITREYVPLLESVGFRDEGRLAGHTTVAGQDFDVATLGLLRTDFEAWCASNEPRLSLTSEVPT